MKNWPIREGEAECATRLYKNGDDKDIVVAAVETLYSHSSSGFVNMHEFISSPLYISGKII